MDLYIFDFDDTLAITDSRVRVVRDGQDLWMTSREFAHFPVKSTDIIDFGDFSRAQGTLIKATVEEMQHQMDHGQDVYIVTARAVAGPVEDWLKSELGRHPPIIATAGSSGKRPWLLRQLASNEYDRVVVYEDCKNNIRDLKEAVEEYNINSSKKVVYSAMCIMHDQSVVQVESHWRPENLLNEWNFRDSLKNFIGKTW